MATSRAASMASGKIHSPGVFALNTSGAYRTQKREWMQRFESKRNVTTLPLATSTFAPLAGGGDVGAVAGVATAAGRGSAACAVTLAARALCTRSKIGAA